MSHQVIISYKGLTIEIQAKCDAAISSLCRIDKVIDNIHKNASTLESEKIKEYEDYLLSAKEQIKKEIDNFKVSVENYKNQTGNSNEYYKLRQSLQSQADNLLSTANDLTGSKLEVIDQMINEGLIDAGNSLIKKMHGVRDLPQNMVDRINQIEDVSLRDLAYRELVEDSSGKLTFEELLSKAQEEYDILLGKKTREVIKEYKEELESKGISSDTLDNVKSIDEANILKNDALVEETIRNKTLSSIIKAIRKQGFIVDTKKNMKLNKEKNIVKLVALKASGQRAEFEVQLNGKFMYHFDKYEGQACQKDIQPFLDDLKNIYDINILHEETIWKNPDKIQTQKYQYVNKNKGRN